MPRIPIFRLGSSSEDLLPPRLASYTPALSLAGLQLGVDNLRHDVHLSTKFVEQTRSHVARLIMHYGNVDTLLAAEAPEAPQPNHFPRANRTPGKVKTGPSDLKPLLAEMHLSALNRAKADSNN